jgi:hypothetical protein
MDLIVTVSLDASMKVAIEFTLDEANPDLLLLRLGDYSRAGRLSQFDQREIEQDPCRRIVQAHSDGSGAFEKRGKRFSPFSCFPPQRFISQRFVAIGHGERIGALMRMS